MAYEIFLPKNKEQKETVLANLLSSGRRARYVRQINWWIAHHYLQGARNFDNINYNTGTLDINYINEDGVLRFRFDDIVSKYQAQIGRLMQVDIAPAVERKSIGLEDLRKASIAQVALDYAVPPSKVDQLKQDLCAPLIKYGLVVLVVWTHEDQFGIDVVPPWEVVPIPPNPVENSDVRGLARTRIVPLDWVQQLSFAKSTSAKVWGEIERIPAPVGHTPDNKKGNFMTFNEVVPITSGNMTQATGTKQDKTQVDMVEFTEFFFKDATGYFKNYEVTVGGKLLHSVDYSSQKLYMPAWAINDIDTGGFWGRSFVSTQIPLNQEMEYTIGRVLQNVQDLDAYGMLLMPTTLGIPNEIIRSSDGIKRIAYEPDYTMPDLKPENITPFNTGLLPVKVIEMGTALMDKIANQPTEMMGGGAPGRVDSSSGLGFLFEVSNTPLTSTASSISIGVSNCYRAILGLAARVWDNNKLIDVTMLDDSLAGVKLDSASGSMSLANNMLPHPDEVTISIRSKMPKSREQEKLELEKALTLGAIDMFEYRVEVRKKGLGLPVGNEGEWQNYRRAMYENILLFGDGKNPGQVIFSPNDIHQVHLRILQAFMARPEFFQADASVRQAFGDHYQRHMEGLGQIPDQAPYPEEAAQEEDDRQRMMAAI